MMGSPERSAELSQKIAQNDVEPITAKSSEKLYQVLNQQRVDLVVIENDLGGFLAGTEILKRLYDDLIRPEAILLAEPTDNIKKRAKDLGIKTVLNPNVDFDEIVNLANGLCSDVATRNEIIPAKARKLVQEFEGIPLLPHLIIKLMNYMTMDVEDIPIKELANDISFDPKAITNLLKMTNSSSMGLGRKITNVMDAVTLLGAKRTISLIFTSTTCATQSKLLKDWSEPLRKWYHQRSILIASTASTFAQNLGKVSADTAFMLRLLQEIGVLVMANSLGKDYSQSIERTREVGQLQLHLIEEKEYRITHADVSAALLQKWKFPQSLIGPVLDHHNPGSSEERSNVERSFLHAMRVGEAVANLSDFAHPIRCQVLNQLLDEYGDEKATACRDCISESVAKTAESCKLFSLPVPDDETMEKLIQSVTASSESQQANELLQQTS
jgi:HD-like signal output (HDOD) protein